MPVQSTVHYFMRTIEFTEIFQGFREKNHCYNEINLYPNSHYAIHIQCTKFEMWIYRILKMHRPQGDT